MSDILNIYKSVANMEVGSIKSRNIDKVKLAVKDGELPLRLLLPSTSGEMDFIAIGNLQKVAWTIRDICLFAPVTKGSGVQQFAKAMVEYLSLYVAQVKANRHPTGTSHILGIEGTMAPIQWAENTYWAVDITLTIEEIL